MEETRWNLARPRDRHFGILGFTANGTFSMFFPPSGLYNEESEGWGRTTLYRTHSDVLATNHNHSD